MAASNEDISDCDRAFVLVFANGLAFGTYAAVDFWLLHRPQLWAEARQTCWIGFTAMLLYFMYLSGFFHQLANSVLKLRRDGSTLKSASHFPIRLYVGSALTFGVILTLVFLTGGMRSPFVAYAGAYVIFGQFLANTKRATLLAIAAGLVLLSVLIIEPIALVAESHALPESPATWHHLRIALALIGCGVILAGAICTVGRDLKKEVQQSAA